MIGMFMATISGGGTPPPPIYDSLLIYLGGQSNGEGVAAGPPIAPYDSPIAGCGIWTGAGFDTLEYNVNNDAAGNNQHGCELSLGYKLNELFGTQIYMVKYAASGKAIDELDGETDFNPNSAELYTTLINKVNNAYEHMTVTMGLNPLIVCIWLQGERDARFTDSSAIYQTNFNLLKSSFATDVFSAAPWWLNVLGDGQRAAFTDPENTFDLVVSAQEAVIAADSDVYKIDLDGKTFIADGLHYDSTSQIAIGNETGQSIYDTVKHLIS